MSTASMARARQARRACPSMFVLLVLALASASGVAPAAVRQTPSDRPDRALMEEGQEVFGAECAECHNDAGSGVGPSFASNAAMQSKERVIRRILEGTPDGGMPAFAASMTDRKIAAVGSFIRNSWDNAYGTVAEADIKAMRGQLKKP